MKSNSELSIHPRRRGAAALAESVSDTTNTPVPEPVQEEAEMPMGDMMMGMGHGMMAGMGDDTSISIGERLILRELAELKGNGDIQHAFLDAQEEYSRVTDLFYHDPNVRRLEDLLREALNLMKIKRLVNAQEG